jgi:prepilin-type N-terminal cleavage/methylation domain-containing protein
VKGEGAEMFGVTEYVKWGGQSFRLNSGNSSKINIVDSTDTGGSYVSFLNSESICIKKRTTKRVGFTLVEVIVVIVIIAILAAIGVPALTGYIDKSSKVKYISMAKTQLTAMQTFVDLSLGENGAIKTGANEVFLYNWKYPTTGTQIGYRIESLTDRGKAEYEELTGDTESFRLAGTVQSPRPNEIVMARLYCTLDGDIKVYHYMDRITNYDSTFQIFYIKDINSTDLVTKEFLDVTMASSSLKPYLTSGFNIFQGTKKIG